MTDGKTGMRYALDESLTSHAESHAAPSDSAGGYSHLKEALTGPGLAALVLKPTLIGGFARCLSLHNLAPAGTEVGGSQRHVSCPIGMMFVAPCLLSC